MSAGAVAAAAAVMNAVRAMGTIVKVEPDVFQQIVERQSEPLVVRAPHGYFSKKIDYVVSYKGLAFFTSSREELRLPPNAEIVQAQSLYIPG
jgi:hypothetical protein